MFHIKTLIRTPRTFFRIAQHQQRRHESIDNFHQTHYAIESSPHYHYNNSNAARKVSNKKSTKQNREFLKSVGISRFSEGTHINFHTQIFFIGNRHPTVKSLDP